MRATFCAFALGLIAALPDSLCAQMFRSEHLTVANTNPPPPPFRDSLYVVGYPDPPQSVYLSPSALYRLQVWAARMETGWRDPVDRVYSKQEEMRDYYLATTQPTAPDERAQVTGPFTEHELRYYGRYILPPPKSALETWESQQQQNELRTPGTRLRRQFQR